MLKWIAASTILLASGLHALADTRICRFDTTPSSYVVVIDGNVNVLVLKGGTVLRPVYGGSTGTNMPDEDAGIWWGAEDGKTSFMVRRVGRYTENIILFMGPKSPYGPDPGINYLGKCDVYSPDGPA